MRSTRHALTASTTLAVLAALIAFGAFRGTQTARAGSAVSPPPAGPSRAFPALAVPTPNYMIEPSETDNGKLCSEEGAIGCDDEQWELDGNHGPSPWGEDANDAEHLLYLPPSLTDTGKLLVFLAGSGGGAGGGQYIGPIAAQQGYHVISLTYPAARANNCSDENTTQETLDCFGNAFREVVTGVNSPNPGGDRTEVGRHPQDAIVNRLVRVLGWAAVEHPHDGWGRYLTAGGAVDWTKVHLAGMSNGSSHVSFMGTLEQFRNVGRVALFAGPDDGDGGTTEETWRPATYIQQSEVPTGARYYGLVHVLNKAPNADHPRLYRIARNWFTFGMESPLNAERFFFDPTPGVTPYFGGAHMLISTNPTTDYMEAHESVARDRECSEYDLDENDKLECKKFEGDTIGYEPAWRCILGTGDFYASAPPTANAGPDQTVECRGGGGADVVLDGSLSKDSDCEMLSHTWTGPFGLAGGPRPTRFFQLGTSLVGLTVYDGWWTSASDTTVVSVLDTRPPALQVTLTPTVLSPANHRLVRIDATVSAADICGGASPTVVLTSITSDQPDDGDGDGDTQGDIREADFGTFDRSFLLRAERAGGDPRGRTYTVTYTATDASGNQAQASATVYVPHLQ